MKIVFATTQSKYGSTLIGRVVPLAQELAHQYDVHVLGLRPLPPNNSITFHTTGAEPFRRTTTGKKRLTGLRLIINMLAAVLKTTHILLKINPDVVIIVKTLPHNVLGVKLWSLLRPKNKIILDVDDFELTANVTSSLLQRAAIHWAERTATKLANHITAATPFLSDHFEQLSQHTKPITLIPTGISPLLAAPINKMPSRQADSHPTLLYSGSLSRSSGHTVELLPEIVKIVAEQQPNVRLIIAGDGDDTVSLKKQFDQLGLADKVIWHGRFTPDEITKLLEKTDIMIDPIDDSISNRAKSSYRVVVAGATGTPLVTSDIGIRPQLIPHPLHHRFFAIPGNSTSYAKKILALLKHPLQSEERHLMQAKSREYQWPTLGQQFKQIIAS